MSTDPHASDGALTAEPVISVPGRTIDPEDLACPLPTTSHETVQLGHGSGGRMTARLIREEFLSGYGNDHLARLDDFALLPTPSASIAVSTDSFVVDPLFFPGGDIGELAVYGTVNDVAVSGARPLYLTVGMILEEGLPLDDLRRVVRSMRRAADRAGVAIVTGDTKVVHRGKGDKLFINTTGIGVMERPLKLGADRLREGDLVIVSGTVGDHGMAILSQRDGLAFDTPILSDTAPLNGLIEVILDAGGSGVHAMRDATRGGLAAVLNEYAEASSVSIRLEEARIPVREPVAGACAFLGLDPLSVANEGKLVVVVRRSAARGVLDAMKAHPLGQDAAIIGDVAGRPTGLVTLHTAIGGRRILDLPSGEQLPRIC